jgi:hypothetical protein
MTGSLFESGRERNDPVVGEQKRRRVWGQIAARALSKYRQTRLNTALLLLITRYQS